MTFRRLKILQVVEATLGGSGRHVLNLTAGLLDRREDVHVLYSTLRADAQFRDGLAALQQTRPEFRSQLLQMSRAPGLSDWSALRQLRAYVHSEGPFDIVHAHCTKAGFLSRLSPLGASIVYTPHGLLTNDPNLTGAARIAICALETFLARLSKRVIVVSRGERECALRTGIPNAKLCLIPNGVDVSSLADRIGQRELTRAALGIRPEQVCIGFVGRLVDHKRPDRLLQAFAQAVARASCDLRLAIVGAGPLEMSLRRSAEQLQIAQRIIWAGPLDGASCMSAFDLLAHTSRSEGMSYVFLEALASGVPVITTRVGGAEELLEDKGAGLVCDPWDSTKFATLLLSAAENVRVREQLSQAAQRVAVQFDSSAMVEATHALYRSMFPVHGELVDPVMSQSGIHLQ